MKKSLIALAEFALLAGITYFERNYYLAETEELGNDEIRLTARSTGMPFAKVQRSIIIKRGCYV